MKNKMPKRILVIDDDNDLREVICCSLKCQFMADVLEASSGNASLNLLLSTPFDLVISDINMPNGDGNHVHTFLRHNLPNLPLIFFTGQTDAVASDAGCIIVEKPDMQRLLEMVQKTISASNASKESD